MLENSPDMKQLRESRKAILNGYYRLQHLPYNCPPKSNHLFSGKCGHLCSVINNDLLDLIIENANKMSVTMYQLLTTSYMLFLLKLRAYDDILIAGILANQYRPEMHQMIGTFVNGTSYRLRRQQ
ncbi:unnamed protein product [Didymodactylos carnosus]|uniref:Uncharacterized protein n=1 Tax=Didymodactylos carnosus TaxID=1234261 RepID=A0A814QS70_9BILA|nr:unnamed protein product [Didymodactylos carnosus]CAF1123484.1 unnamed protein product [Didymodactylos carnosus]CAF3815231.1 unnamed protein product [Didymodactylos carnosus]CAF3887046.1 unnamed protein product [Didymodactylos carnosus]